MNVHIQVALAAAMRIGQALPFQADNFSGLRAFGNLDVLIAGEPHHFDFRAKSGLHDGYRHRVIEVRVSAFEIRMRGDLKDHVQVARRAAIFAGFSFAGNAKSRIRINAGWNPQVNRPTSFQASLATASGTCFTHNLTRAPAIRASARDGEESLLVVKLSPAAAGLAGRHARASLRTGAVAGLAEFQTRQPDFRIHAGCGLLETQLHVIAKIRAALRAITGTAAAKNILETEKIPKDILKFGEYGLIDAAVETAARESRVAKPVIRSTLVGIG